MQIGIIFILTERGHDLMDRSIVTFDEYPVDGVLFIESSTKEGFCHQFFSKVGQCQV